jgi:hypothetical protein
MTLYQRRSIPPPRSTACRCVRREPGRIRWQRPSGAPSSVRDRTSATGRIVTDDGGGDRGTGPAEISMIAQERCVRIRAATGVANAPMVSCRSGPSAAGENSRPFLRFSGNELELNYRTSESDSIYVELRTHRASLYRASPSMIALRFSATRLPERRLAEWKAGWNSRVSQSG